MLFFWCSMIAAVGVIALAVSIESGKLALMRHAAICLVTMILLIILIVTSGSRDDQSLLAGILEASYTVIFAIVALLILLSPNPDETSEEDEDTSEVDENQSHNTT